MNYIIFDLEFNQGYNNQIEIKCPFEIIQIGAIKLNEDFTTIDTFNALVKPLREVISLNNLKKCSIQNSPCKNEI